MALVSLGFESLCLRLLAGLSVAIALAGMLSNEFFPQIQALTLKLLNWQIVDENELKGTSVLAGYKVVNRIEGLAWMIFAVLTCRRFQKYHKSGLEPIYVLAFLFFGISDFAEAMQYPGWLGLWKVYNLLVLLYCRSYLLRVHYTNSKVF